MNPQKITHTEAQASADALLKDLSNLNHGNYFHCLFADLLFSELCSVITESWLAGLPVSLNVKFGEATASARKDSEGSEYE